ncbi:hypothetical protein J2S21_002896 [Peribacillus cavernae]|nr:hypothetical protein [Peribacillus cavernae]MDQ0219798.1 hypothetical protein [Peribacillus cavernae]
MRNPIKRLDKDNVTVIDSSVAKKSMVGTSFGNAMEWFDFGIYSFLL